ncbi:MAG: ATP-binding protein [Acidobacteriaceae bacterium]
MLSLTPTEFTMDAIDHRRSEGRPDKSDRKLQAIFEATQEGMLLLDNNLIYVEANPAACKIFGRSREEILGKELGSLIREHEGSNGQLNTFISGDSAAGAGEIRLPDGKLRQIEYTARSNVLPNMHLLVTRDVTERKRLESQLQQAQKMEAVGQLAGGIAHDFNNMLTVIRGYCELLQRLLPPESEHRRYADTILQATEKATLTTQQLLAFSRRQVVQVRETNLNSVVQEMGKLLQKLIGEDIELRIALDDRLGIVMADPGQIGQILLNLAVNSRDAMPKGGVIRIETSNVKIDDTYARTHLKVTPGDYVMLTVTDTGCGMSAEVLSRIFEPFFTTKAAGKGTGLGLSTVYGIIEQSKGAVYVYSEPGEGTSFKIYLPRVDKLKGEAGREIKPDRRASCVVVIDDDLESGKVIEKFLTSHGYQVLTSRSGVEAVQLCERHGGKIELVISDITMPGTDGQDIQGYFDIRHPETKVIYISGYTEGSLRDRGILAPDSVFLQKPFRCSDLKDLIDEVLGTGSSAIQ